MSDPASQPDPAASAPDDTVRLPSEADIRRGLRQAGCEEAAPPPVSRGAKLAVLIHIAILLGLGVLLYLLRFDYFQFLGEYQPLARRLLRGAMAVLLIVTVARAIRVSVIDRMDDTVSSYNVSRILRLVVVLLIALVVISVIFRNWTAAAVSLGLVSLVLSFALQTPITSFIGWLYILIREPYRVGDRIQIGDATGDVIDLSYFDTTLWEFGGPYLSTDHPSGRIIKFPNANVLSVPVYNYSWPLFPYIWNEISFQVAYDSDLAWVASIMRKVASEELGASMMKRIETYRQLIVRTPVDQLQVREHPVVLFKVSENTWVEPVVRYLVDPRRAGTVKSQLTHRMLEQLNAQPQRVLFPKGDNR